MKWESGISQNDDIRKAVDEVCSDLTAQIKPETADLVFAFISPHHKSVWDAVPGLLTAAFPKAAILGCSGAGIIGSGREVEGKPCLALAVASLPRVTVRPFSVAAEDLDNVNDPNTFWQQKLNLDGRDDAAVIVFPDPFSCAAENLIRQIDRALPSSTVVGGLPSGSQQVGDCFLFCGSYPRVDGVVGVTLSGDIVIDTIVAQGCRPIGNPMFITKCDRQLILELDGKRPAEALSELFSSLSEHDQELLRYSLFVGLVMREGRTQYEHGDFLIRNVFGLEAESGALIVGAELKPNQVIQFHLRDREASVQDLDQLLASYHASQPSRPAGVMLFSCLGRGKSLYGKPDYDSQAIIDKLGPVPIAGFFCNGEIGPVQGKAFVHGYTSVITLFRSPE
jgi:small ligand-binding sensory domain FIST